MESGRNADVAQRLPRVNEGQPQKRGWEGQRGALGRVDGFESMKVGTGRPGRVRGNRQECMRTRMWRALEASMGSPRGVHSFMALRFVGARFTIKIFPDFDMGVHTCART